MARYIDADALYDDIEKFFDGCCVYDVSTSEAVSDFQNIVDRQPTAYDVEKVVEEIKKSTTDNDGLIVKDGEEPMIWKSKAIDIVTKGGV